MSGRSGLNSLCFCVLEQLQQHDGGINRRVAAAGSTFTTSVRHPVTVTSAMN